MTDGDGLDWMVPKVGDEIRGCKVVKVEKREENVYDVFVMVPPVAEKVELNFKLFKEKLTEGEED